MTLARPPTLRAVAPSEPVPPPSTLVRLRSSLDVSRASVINSVALHQQALKETLALDVKGALDPHSTFLKVWRQVLLAAIVYELFLLPFVVTFEPHATVSESPEILAFYVCEILFCGDFGVKLNTGFYEDGSVHRDTRRAMLKYVKSANFAIDVAAILPFSLMYHPNKASNMYLEFHKLLRLRRLPEYLSNLDDVYARYFEALRIFKTIGGTMFLSHGIACIRFWFGYDDHHDNHWLAKGPEYGGEHLSVRTTYLQSLFWGFGMLTGFYEGELPREIPEFVLNIAITMCGFCVFTYLCVMFFMLSKCENGHLEEAEARINQLKHIMAFHQVPERLQAQTLDYMKRYSTDAESNDREAMKLVCPSIAKDLQVELLKDTVARIPVFTGCSPEFVRALTNALEVMFMPAHCTVFREGDEGDAMYIIHSGVLDVILDHFKVRELRKGDFVGEMSLFSDRSRSATVVTTTYSILYKLSRFHTERVLEGYPHFVPMIRRSVTELIANADQLTTTKETKPQTSKHAKQRRGSALSSQVLRLMRAEVKKSISSFTKKNSVVPDSSFVGNDQREGLKAESTDKSPTETMVNRLRRAVSVRPRVNADSVKLFYDQYTRQHAKAAPRVGLARLLLENAVDADSRFRLWWLLVLQSVLVYDFILVPLEIAFPAIDLRVWYIFIFNILTDLILVVDIYINFNLSFTVNSEKIIDPEKSALRYLKQHFIFDFLFAFPYWAVGSAADIRGLRLPRLLRLWHLRGHLREIEKLHHVNSRRKLLQFGLLLLMLCHVVACLYFSTTFMEGFSEDEDAWIPTDDVQLVRTKNGSGFLNAHNSFIPTASSELAIIASMQYFRALYYATNVLTGLGKTVEPSSDAQYAIAVVFMFSGFIITAMVVDNVQKRFTASAFEQKEFVAVRTRIQLFLRRQNAPLGIHHRVNSYLDYWWSAHRGAHLQDLLGELPIAYRREVLRSICNPALQSLALLGGVRPVLSQLETAFVDCAQFVLYGQGEFVYHAGDNAHRLHFLLHGSVHLKKGHTVLKKVPVGGFFGTRALEGDEIATRYAEDAIAASGCILIRVSRQDVFRLREVFSDITPSLLQLERRLHDNKLARFTSDAVSAHLKDESIPRWKAALFDPLEPDSVGSVAWETWLFCAMTIQWITILIHASFGVDPEHFVLVDSVTVFLECSFFIDIYVRCRMGYYEFGNKVMEVRRIRQRYLRSRSFVIDIVAVTPLFAVNWMLKTVRYEILNINKLVRLLKVPGQFRQLEQRYLKWTTELRIMKLVYYTFLAVHLSGCVYHDFASHLSTANLKDPRLSEREIAFGWNHWLLGKQLASGDKSLRYFSSIFWSFGLMSASYQGELPKTTPQCVFSVMTMMTGFFLFAYVIGNFSDVIEMMDADSREFNARLGSVRHLLGHFTLPVNLSAKMKGYFFFRRYHTITQEHLIESSLPPSLVTDIRLLNLQKMIHKVAFMSGMEPAITRMLVAQFSQVLVVKDEFVYRFGEEGTDMFFVFTGVLAVLSQQTAKKIDMQLSRSRRPTAWSNISTSGISDDIDPKTFRNASQLIAGDFFGENALFSDAPRNAFVVARTSCILYSLSRHSLSIVFDLYPDWKKQVIQSVRVQQKQHRIHGSTTETLREVSSSLSRRDEDDSINGDGISVKGSRVAFDRNRSRGLSAFRENFKRGVEAQSQLHILWLRMIVFCTVFNAILAPYRISVDPLERWTGVCIIVRVLDIFSDIAFIADIWFNCLLRESALSVELYEQSILETYKRERLLWDLISALPIDYVLSIFAMEATIWIRLLRCVKVVNLKSYLNEIDRRSVSYEIARFGTISLLCAIYIFWCACAYLALAVFGGFGMEWAAWLPAKELEYDDSGNPDTRTATLRLLRGLAYSATAFAKKARTYYPETVGHLGFSIAMSFGGVLMMAFMIGEIANLYISFIRNQVDFRKNVITLELFLSRYRVSSALRDRVHAYLSTLWSTYSGVNYETVFADLPLNMRTEVVRHIAEDPMQSFAGALFGPLLRGDNTTMQSILRCIARELRFEGYPRGETVISEGVINDSMYFVIHGHLVMTSSRGILQPADHVRFRKGQWFGEKGLMTVSVSPFSVRALKACDLFSLTSHSLMESLRSHDFLWAAFLAASEVVSEVRALSGNEKLLTTELTKWKAAVKKVLTKRRNDWIGSRPPSRPGFPNRLLPSSKAATQWSSLLVDVLDGDSRTNGIGLLDPMLQLLTESGVTYHRPTDLLPRESRVYSAGSTSGRMRFRDMVLKLSKSETRSTKSARSTKVHSVEEAADQVEAFRLEE